jgi:glycosyltransferase EpsD
VEIGLKKKVLFCATVDIHFKAFHLPYLKWFKEQGWEVHVAAEGDNELPFVDQKYNIPIQRSPFKKENLNAYRKLKLLINKNKYDIIHCHTPMGGVLTRLAANRARKSGTKVMYTAHGFHFCKGAPIINWLLYYPIERGLSRLTNCLITINQEDYNLAINHGFKAHAIKHVHGVGVNTDIFKPSTEREKEFLRHEHGYRPNEVILFYAAEFNKNKNQKLLIESISQIKDEIQNLRLILAGDGPLLRECKELALKLEVDGLIDFLGYRNDIGELLRLSDIAVASSLREGLPVNILEAMACGLPVIANDNRGHRELIVNNKTGWILKNNVADFSKKIKLLTNNNDLRTKLGIEGRNIILKRFSINKVLQEQSSIYTEHTGEMEDKKWAVR